mgnify:CR=1 FL=1
MTKRFDLCLKWIFQAEGGYNYIASDTGGETILGISRVNHPKMMLWREIDMKFPIRTEKGNVYGSSALSREITEFVKNRADIMAEIVEIYQHEYWEAHRCYIFNSPIDIYLFDSVVNMPAIRGKQILQSWAGCKPDGIIGPQTVKAVRDCDLNPDLLLVSRLEYYKTRPGWERFGEGWTKRLQDLKEYADKIA